MTKHNTTFHGTDVNKATSLFEYLVCLCGGNLNRKAGSVFTSVNVLRAVHDIATAG